MPKEVICETECLACGKMVKIYELGFIDCPHCGEARAELTVMWEFLEDKENE